MNANTPNTFAYGDLTVDAAKLAPAGVDALIRRGISHLLGNEVSAKVNKDGSWFKGFVEAEKREPTAEEIASKQVEFRKAAIESLYDGTIGTRSGGPRVDPVQAEMNVIAKREIADILRAKGIKKFPTGENTVTLGEAAYTGAVLIERRLAKFGDRIRKEASKIVGERARKAEAAKNAVAAVAGVNDAEALGL